MKVIINFSNRWLYTIIAIGILAIIGVGVYAYVGPNGVGHDRVDIQPCSNGEILQTSGGAWSCVDMPSGGITTEVDPTVPSSIKDGISWGEVTGIPAGFADSIDNTGITEELDPTVPACSNGQILQTSGGTWDCVDIPSVEGVPSGFCMFSDTQTSCPSGWTRRTEFDGRTIYGASSNIGGIGGASTHTHTTGSLVLTIAQMPLHSHSYTGVLSIYSAIGSGSYTQLLRTYGTTTGSTGSGQAHNHGPTGNADSWSPYRRVIVCCKD